MPRWTTRMSPPSSLTSRYLPLRSMPVILWPSSLPTKCFLLGCRRIERMPLTSTCLMRLPTTSFSRSRFSVSTSGSSGIDDLGLGVVGLRVGAVARCRQRAPRLFGGRLFGLLLRATLAAAALVFVDKNGRVEPLGVVGTVLAHLIARQRVEALGRQFLQPGLVVLPTGAGGGLGDAVLEEVEDELVCGLPTAVEVDGADHGLHGVGEDRRLLAPAGRVLTLAEGQRRADAEFGSQVGEHAGVHHRRPNLGQLALGQAGERAEEVVGDDQAEHRVTEELEAFVGLAPGRLRAPRTVG